MNKDIADLAKTVSFNEVEDDNDVYLLVSHSQSLNNEELAELDH
jgi:hypothetical protein